MAYLEWCKNIWKSLPICVMEMNSKLLNRYNVNNRFKHWNNGAWAKRKKGEGQPNKNKKTRSEIERETTMYYSDEDSFWTLWSVDIES